MMKKNFYTLNFALSVFIVLSLCLSCKNNDSRSDIPDKSEYQKQHDEELAKKEEEEQRLEEERLEKEKQKLEEEKQKLEEEKQKLEEERLKKINGPDWLQGTWSAKLFDKGGDYLGTTKFIIDNGNVDMYVDGKFIFTTAYIYSDYDESIHFVNSKGQLEGGMQLRERDRCLIGNNGTVFRKTQTTERSSDVATTTVNVVSEASKASKGRGK